MSRLGKKQRSSEAAVGGRYGAHLQKKGEGNLNNVFQFR
jgi:hypothetical protein